MSTLGVGEVVLALPFGDTVVAVAFCSIHGNDCLRRVRVCVCEWVGGCAVACACACARVRV